MKNLVPKGFYRRTQSIKGVIVSMEGFTQGGKEIYSVAISDPLTGYNNLTKDRARLYYDQFVELLKARPYG